VRTLWPVDLFDSLGDGADGTPAVSPSAPLAVRMRPRTLDEVVGQQHLLGTGSPLRRLVEPVDPSIAPASLVLWGPPGTGKTTLAYLVAHGSGRRFVELSAVTAGVRDVRAVIDAARRTLLTTGTETVLFIDEVHRFSKTQQDALLPSVENRWVTLVAATTENPSFSVISPLLSRSLLLTLRPLERDSLETLVRRAVDDPRGLAGRVELAPAALEHLLRLAGADARKALTILEAAAGVVTRGEVGVDRAVEVDEAAVETAVDVAAVRYDRDGDQHYDVASAFIKSMRGSDVDAALHYLARMIAAGEDPRFIARRVVIAAAEEVGMADPGALGTAVAAAQAVAMIGMPEARIILAQAVVHVATAPKSNASYKAVDAAIADVRAGRGGPVPAHLRDAHYSGAERLGHGAGYTYAHDAPHGVAAQQYAPDDLVGVRYYVPGSRGAERAVAERVARIRAILDGA
jgi:putative ATPase